ncbi:VapE domain-containing protein [Gluconacetobacter dulcium]|nr:VapE domain-containing protein [Gluconacetobacter dulcium]
MNADGNTEFARAIGPVARELLGEPTPESTKDKLCFGTGRGSLVVDLRKGVWNDHGADKGGGTIDLVMQERRTDKAGALQWLRDHGFIERRDQPQAAKPKARIVATYDYADENGEVLFQVVRMDPKDFRQRAPNGQGGWTWSTKGVRRILYHLSAVLDAVKAGRTVYVAEGEKGVHAIEGLGLPATCSPGGAGKWRMADQGALRGADVVILPDNDEPGRKHAQQVKKALAGIARSVRVLTLPDLPDKGDVADWIAAGGTAEELAKLTAAMPGYDTAVEPKEILKPDWMGDLLVDDRGNPISNVANVLAILRADPAYSDAFAYDEMSWTTLLMKPLEPQAEPFKPRLVTEADATLIQERVQMAALRRVGNDVIHQAIERVAYERRFHPVRDYLNGLRWDGTPRLGKWLSYYLGAEHTPYTSAVGRMFLIGMVARIFEPGGKMDYMLVLQGPQGVRKSTACAILGGNWISENLPDLRRDQAASDHVRGKWMIEVAELSAMGKADQETLKHFITRTTERFRPAYGKREIVVPRQCVFVGTTNKEEFLTDETGGRRYWPVKVGPIDTDALTHDRDQLFAEAVHAFRQGEHWWPDGDFEVQVIKPEQDARFEMDEWEPIIRDYLAGRTRVTIPAVGALALGFENKKLGTTEQRKIKKILTCIGWTQKRNEKERWWEPVR